MRFNSTRGDRVLRPTGRKDRHSKISTAKGPRDRRLRLSAHTAIQFYDVQDRLRCNRPSEAIDWLMKEAKSAIDALDSADQEPEQEEQGKTEYFPNTEDGNGNQSQQQQLNEIQWKMISTGFQDHPQEGNGNSTEFQHHFNNTINWSNPNSNPLHNILGQDQLLLSPGGTLQSSYSSPSFLALMNSPLSHLNFDQIPEVGPSGNCFPGEGFAGNFVSPGIGGEGEKLNPAPNNPSSAPCLLHYHDH